MIFKKGNQNRIKLSDSSLVNKGAKTSKIRRYVGIEGICYPTHITEILSYKTSWICRLIYIIINCNMGRRDLPDMYARGHTYIRQIPTAHVTSDMYHFRHSAQTKIKLTHNHIDLLRLHKEC